MVNLIIKEMDLDACGEQTLENSGASGLYDLWRVQICRFFILFYLFFLNRHSFISGDSVDEGPSGQVRRQRGDDPTVS